MARKKRGKYSRNISNLKRAINKLGGWSNKPYFSSTDITNIKTSPLYVEWTENGVRKKSTYADIDKTSKDPQMLRLDLQVQVYENQKQEALKQLQESGKVSTQFKISASRNASRMVGNIKEFEKLTSDMTKDQVRGIFEGASPETMVTDADDIDFSDSAQKEEFYHQFGFTEMNSLTVAMFKALR